MIKNPQLLESLEKDLARKESAVYPHNLRIFEALYLEARALGAFPLEDCLDGIEVDIRLARVLSARKPV